MNDVHPATAANGPLPLVLGITGHRDLRDEDIPGLEHQVRQVLTTLRRKYPYTPLVVLSSLAEGADRLASRVALAMGAELIAFLPLPAEDYEQDFAGAASREDFRRLLGQARQCVVAPLVEGNTAEAVRQPGPARDRQYAAAGAAIARHGQILLALWDGEKASPKGGTADTVRFQLEGVPEPYGPPHNPLDPVDSGPVWQIVTPRRSNPTPAGTPLTLVCHYPAGFASRKQAEQTYHRLYDRIDRFNQDAVALGPALPAGRDCLLPAAAVKDLPEADRDFVRCFATADTLAVHFQRRALRVLIGLLVLVFLAALFFNAADIWNDRFWGRSLFVVMLGAAYALSSWAAWTDYESKYLDYRALAEGMRVQFFWRLAGMPDSAADHYLRRQRSELDWIRDAIRFWNLTTQAPPPARLRDVLAHWVSGQRAYYEHAALRDQGRLVGWKWSGNIFFFTGLGWAGARVFMGPVHEKIDALGAGRLETLLLHTGVVLLSVAPVVTALLYSYAKTRALSEHAKQYDRMGQIFRRAERHLTGLFDAGREAEAHQLLRELGKEALLENSDWVQLHRDRPLQMPR